MDRAVGDFAQGDILIEGQKDCGSRTRHRRAGSRRQRHRDRREGHRCHPGHGRLPPPRLGGTDPRCASRTARPSASIWARHIRDFAPHYRPDDMYAGNLITALGCIDAGITCVIDNSHNSRSSAHADMAVKALINSGIRAVFASGAATFGEWDRNWPEDVTRLRRDFFASRRSTRDPTTLFARADQGGLADGGTARAVAIGRRRRTAKLD